MKRPQVIAYESDGWLASQVRRLASESAWLLREPRRPEALLELANESPAVVMLKLERDLLEGLSLLAQITEEAPDAPVIVVSDVKMEGHEQRAQLSALAFDLGARYVLFPPLQQSVMEDLVSGLMAATIERTVGISPEETDA